MNDLLKDLRCDLKTCGKKLIRTSMVIHGKPFFIHSGQLVTPKWHLCREHEGEVSRWLNGLTSWL